MFVDITTELAFEKSLAKIKEATTKDLIFKQLEKLNANPFAGKKLSGNLANKYSLRFGDYRLIYMIKPCPLCQQILKNKLSCESINPLNAENCILYNNRRFYSARCL
jgi:mRNA-degrading endonuclease RelE of RelBE toxin-antitoxin system